MNGPRRLAAANARSARLAWVAIAALLWCCKSDAERARQGQVARLAEHIDRLRRADNHAKRAPLAALASVPCPDAEACALQDLCLRAYQLHQAALDGTAALERLSRADGGAPPGLSQRFERAQTDLTQAKTLSEQCAEEQVRLMRRALVSGTL